MNISQNITIKGNGPPTNTVTIDARNITRIFNIQSDGIKVTFINITFANGRVIDDYGGAINNIHSNSVLTFINCSFINNTATSTNSVAKAFGGAIYNLGNNLTITDSTFTNNLATATQTTINTITEAIAYGGAIYNEGDNLSVIGSTFTNNTATANMLISTYMGGTIDIHAYAYGGGIYNAGDKMTVKNSTFTNNTANGSKNITVVIASVMTNNAYGGGIHNLGANMNVMDSIFRNNNVTATYITDASFGTRRINAFGSAISNDGDYFIVDNSTFTNNTGTTISNTGVNCTVDNSTFTNNMGAIQNTGYNLIVKNSAFKNNTDSAISNSGVNCTVSNSTFINNTFVAGSGGAISNSGANFTVVNSNFTNNNADHGGAIYNGGANFTVANSTFISNKANFYGGAIRNWAINFTVANSTFINNCARDGGAIVNTRGNNSIVINSTFITNNATGNGGAIFNHQSDNFIVQYNRFLNNTASSSGSTICDDGGSVNASYNWWGSNDNPSQYVSGVVHIDNYYTLVFNTTDTGLKVVGDTINVDYYFVLNGTDDGSDAYKLPYFTTTVSFNNVPIGSPFDARFYSSLYVPVTAVGFNIPITASSDNAAETIILTTVGKAYTNSTIVVNPVGSTTGDTVTITGQLINYLGVTQIKVIVDGDEFFVPVNSSGGWTLDYPTKRADNIEVIVSLSNHDNYYDFINSTSFDVGKGNINVVLNVIENSDGSATIIVKASYQNGNPASGFAVEFSLNGEIISSGVTDGSGLASYIVATNKLVYGKNNIIIKVDGSNDYYSVVKSFEYIHIIEVDNGNDTDNDADNTNEINNNNNDNTSTDVNASLTDAQASMKKTGIPIVAILLFLITLVGIRFNRPKK